MYVIGLKLRNGHLSQDAEYCRSCPPYKRIEIWPYTFVHVYNDKSLNSKSICLQLITMVRTKKGPAVSKGSKVHRDGGKYIRHNRIFNDHTGKPALMSWSAPERNGPLPPLSSWIYYMVYPDVRLDFDGNALYWDLTLLLSVG